MVLNKTDGSFQNAQGDKIFTQSWIPEGTPKAILMWAHGIHEHCSRFEHMYADFCAAGIAVYAWDHIGHGRSGGKEHQFAQGFDGVVADGMQYARMIRAGHNDGVPMIVSGVSMGGLVASHMALETTKESEPLEFAACLLVAPAIDVPWTPIMKVQAAMGALLAKYVPNLRLVPAVPLEKLSKCQEAVKSYAEDPMLKVGNVRAKAGYEILQGFKLLKKRYGDIKLPLLVLHASLLSGDLDEVTDLKASQNFVKSAGSADKKFVLLPGMYHLVLHEPDQVRVMGMMKQFILSRTTQAVTTGDSSGGGGGGGGGGGVVENAIPGARL